MDGHKSHTGVLQLLIQIWLLSIAFGVSQMKAENHEILSCKTRGVFLSLNRTLAPLGGVASSYESTFYPATNIYHFGYGEGEYIDTWCSIAESDPDPYIEMELTSPVLITQILFSGRTSTLGIFHATNLTLEYSLPGNKTVLNYYTTESGDIKYFAAPDLNSLVPLEQPLLTERVRLRIVEWFISGTSSVEYICLGVGLYGCLATEAIAMNSGIISTTVERQFSSPFQSATTDDDNSETAAQTIIRDYQALAIVLPIALLTIAINALLVGVSVYICVFLKRSEKDTNKEKKIHGYENLEWSSNSVELNDLSTPGYVNTPSKGSSRKESVVKKVDNPIYGSSPVSQLEETDINHDAHIYTSASETGYEPIDNDMHTIHKAGKEEDMLDNLTYGRTDSCESESTRLSKLQQCEATDMDLKGNESYNLAPTTSVQDEGEYSYPIFNVVSPTQMD